MIIYIDYQDTDVINPHDPGIVKMCIAILDRAIRDLESTNKLDKRLALEWLQDKESTGYGDGTFYYRDVLDIIQLSSQRIQYVDSLVLALEVSPSVLCKNG